MSEHRKEAGDVHIEQLLHRIHAVAVQLADLAQRFKDAGVEYETIDLAKPLQGCMNCFLSHHHKADDQPRAFATLPRKGTG